MTIHRSASELRRSFDGTLRPQSFAALPGSADAESSAPVLTALVQPSPFSLQPLAFRSSSAFSLVELLIALSIASFCMVAMLGLLPSGLKSAKNTTDQTAAASLLNTIALDLRSTPSGSNTTPLYGLALPTAGTAAAKASTNFFFNEDGSTNSTNTSLSTRYGVLLTLSNPTAYTTTAWIQIYWPPTVASTNLLSALGIMESFVTINRQ